MPKEKIKNKKYLKLEYYRLKYDFTQEEFAKALGIKQSTYSDKIRGKSNLSYDQMMDAQKVLNNKALVIDGVKLSLDEIFLN